MPDDFDDIIKALAHPLRRDILRWLKEPQRYFAAQHHSLENGVCAGQIDQRAGLLSGGEQQMLAIGRALMARPKLLLLDEPSMGLSPIMVDKIFEVVADIHGRGTTILLVEQNAQGALSRSNRAYILETGSVTKTGSGKELLNDPAVMEAYLGVA